MGGLVALALGRACRGVPPRRRAARRPVAGHAPRGNDARPVEDGAPGRDRRRVPSSIDFLRFNVEFMLRIYQEQPISSQGVWNLLEYRPLEGFVFAVSPFNFTAIAGNLPSSPALMGNTVVWKPAARAMLSALLPDAALPGSRAARRRDQPRPGSGATIGDAALASPRPRRDPLHRLDAGLQRDVAAVGDNIDRYRNYPRIVGETGGKDFIVAHPSADVARSRPRSCAARSSTRARSARPPRGSTRPSNLWPRAARAPAGRVATIKVGDVSDFGNFMGAVIDGALVQDAADGDRGGEGARRDGDRRRRRLRRLEGCFVEPTVIETA